MNISDLIAQAAWRGTLVLAAGFATAWWMGRASAAVRHYLWVTVFGALLVLPAAFTAGPKWALAPAADVTVLTVRPQGAATSGAAAPASRQNPIPWIYGLGVLAVAFRFAAGAVRTRRMLAGGRVLERADLPKGLRVIESDRAPVPMVWGILRPVVVLPVASRAWSADRLRTVLLHELIHIERRDLLAQMIGQAACCLYWFHPLAWMAAREMRKERERACDDAVLGRGVAAAEYAGHLVDLVRGLTVGAPAMAEANDFEGRVRALLDRGRNRSPLTRTAALTVAALACVLILPIGSITSHAQDRGALAGIVMDPSGSRVPGTVVLAKNLDGSNQETATADAAGEYGFRAIPPGRYEVSFKSPGFKLAKLEMLVTAGTAARADAHLAIGEVSEVVTVVGSGKQLPPAAVTSAAPGRIPVGGNVQPLRLIRQPRPFYPPELQQQGVAGKVMIRAIVGKDGSVLNPQVINTDVHPGLARAALDAVREWRYDPSRLNGVAVETLTSIDINFELQQ
jgi:TonB family protein